MAEIAAAFLGPVIEVVKWVGKPIMRQFSYLCCFTTNINSLKNEAEKLDDATKELEMAVQTETENLQRIVPAVTTWLRHSNNIKDEITGILSEAKNIESGCLKLGVRFSLSRKAKKMTDYTKGFRGEKNFDVITLPGLPPAAQTVPLENTYAFASRKKIEEDIMTTLRDGNVSLIGIHGMGGLGKTTLANKISKRVLDEHVFQAVAMAVVSQEPDYSKIQVEIGTNLGLKLTEETSQGIIQKLHAKLSGTSTGAKRTLLILDDVWKRINLEKLGIPCDSKWCTILVTSRQSDTLRAMGCEVKNKFGMESLHDKEAWDLFRGKAGPCVDDARLNSIAKEVVRECGGLPIALVVVALALKDEVNASKWENARREMKQCDLEDIPGYLDEVYSPLKLSYDFLESPIAKSLCLLCCLFPEDYDIPIEQLTYFCMGLGICIRDLKGAKDKVSSLIDSLKGRSLLLDSDKSGHVKMHDVVRDVCAVIAKKEGYIGNNNSTWFSSSHDSDERNGFPNLRLLFLSLAREKKSKFDIAYLEEIKDLDVLCIESYSFTTLIPHPQSLTKLKTLILHSCGKLKTISFVGQLVNLEILICRGCDSIEELPSEMKKLKRLKLLELTYCIKLQSIGRGIISGLVELEELVIYGSFNKWETEDREEKENAALRELELLKKLTCLKIEIEDPALAAENMHIMSKLERFHISIASDGDLPLIFDKEMSLCLNTEIHLGNWIEKQLIRDTECLYLSGNGANNVDLAKLRNIRSLTLSKCESTKSIERSSVVDDDAFRFMEYLVLEDLPKLQEICDGPVWFQNLKELTLSKLPALNKLWNSNQNNLVPFFSNLSSIRIRHCDSLRNLEQLSLAGTDCLPQLQKLYIKECEMMEKVFLCFNQQVIRKVFPKLRTVKLVRLPNLETFYQGIQGIEFPLLTKLKIKGCPKMKSIIIGRNQNNLGEIISSSANINDGDSSHYFCQSEKVSFGSLKVLKIDHNPFCGDEIPSSLFNGLEELTIDKYEGNKSIFTLPLAKNLVNLRVLEITECDEMLKVIEVDEQVASGDQRILLFPKLVMLELCYLPKLVSFCECKCEVELPSLMHLWIARCPSMKNLSLGSFVSTPALKDFSTDLSAYLEVEVGFNVSFDSLKSLTIEGNKNPFHHHRISVSLFNRLEILTFSWSKGVASLVSSSAVENLVNLKRLEIEFCDEMLVKVIKDNEVEEDEKVLSEGTVLFPKLETISLRYLDKLVSFCEWKCYIELPSLRELQIWQCPNIERFSLGLVAAPNLKTLTIDGEYVDACEDLNSLLQQHYLAREKEQLRRRRKVVKRSKKERVK